MDSTFPPDVPQVISLCPDFLAGSVAPGTWMYGAVVRNPNGVETVVRVVVVVFDHMFCCIRTTSTYCTTGKV